MSIHSNIQPTIWVHPRRARVLLGLKAVLVDLRTGQLYTTSGDWVGVDDTLPIQGEYSRRVSAPQLQRGA